MRSINATIIGLLFLVFACSGASATTVTSTLIETNTTWGATPGDSVYVVDPGSGSSSTLTIRAGATLTIVEGTRVKVAPGVRIVVGSTTAGSLVAIGTVLKPIVFEANNGVVGGWWGIDFTNNSDLAPAASQLIQCVIRQAGHANGSGAPVRVTDSDGVTITSCRITEFNGRGIVLDNAHGPITGCAFSDPGNTGTFPASGDLSSVASLFSLNKFVAQPAGKYAAIQLRTSDLAQSATLVTPPAGFCYITTVNEDILVDNASKPVLTIEAGTSIKFEGGSMLRVGSGQPGGLLADQVVFTSASDDVLGDTNGDGATVGAPGQWYGIQFQSETLDSQTSLTNCMIRFGGAGVPQITITDAEPTITGCHIEQGGNVGLAVTGQSAKALGVTGNTLGGSLRQEMGGTIPALQNLVPHNTVLPSGTTNRGYDGYVIRQTDLSESATLPAPPAGFCYITTVNEDINVYNASQPVLTIEPRTMIKFEGGSQLRIGFGQPGALVADQVVFTSASDDTLGDTNGDGTVTKGDTSPWAGMLFLASTRDDMTSLTNCIIRYGVGNNPNSEGQIRIVDSNPTLRGCWIERASGGAGLSTNWPAAPAIQACLFRGNEGYEICAPLPAMCALIAQNTVRTHPSKIHRFGLEIVAGPFSGTWVLPRPEVPFAYVVKDSIVVPAGQSLTIQPGVVMKFAPGRGLTVSGTLLVQGQVGVPLEAPVVFTALADDYWLRDTDGNDPTPNEISPGELTLTPGSWRYVKLLAGSQNSVIQGAIFRYGGNGGAGQLDIRSLGSGTSPAVQVLDSHFYLDLNGPAPAGVHLVGSYAKLERCSFFGPSTRNGVQNDSPIIADAPSCWWGAVAGPLDPSDGAPCQNVFGTGVGVSDYVNYCSPGWLVSGPDVLDAPIDPKGVIRTGILAMGPIPSRGSVSFTIDVATGSQPALEIFDSAGRRVRQVDLGNFGGTRANVSWDARDERGQRVGPGVYFARITHGGASGTERIVLIR